MNARVPVPAVDTIDDVALQSFVDERWDGDIVPRLTDYIAIPAKSPAFDREWVAHGHLERVIAAGSRRGASGG